jgi:uncharacterized protein
LGDKEREKIMNPFYVYALKDPRTKPAKIFYIGKGTGIRAWEHERHEDDSEKYKIISEIKNSGHDVVHVVLVDNLTENQALKIEAELISTFGTRSNGGILANKVKPNVDLNHIKSKINVPDGCYEKAQMGLALMKDAVMEMARANKDGIRNGDIAKYLGLQSDYGGGSKDYLSYSLLGLLMREGMMKRNEKKRHISVIK